MSELERIKGDLAKARERIARLAATPPPTQSTDDGQPLAWNAATSTNACMPNGALQWHNQIRAREADVVRLESEFVNAMLAEHKWSASTVIESMQHKCAAPIVSPPERITVETDRTKEALAALLANSGRFVETQLLKDLL